MDPAPVLDELQHKQNWKQVKNLFKFLTGFHGTKREEALDFDFGIVERVPENVDLKRLELNPKVVGSVVKGVDRVQKDYKLGRMLGEGAFAKVFVARFKQSQKAFACKVS